MTGYTLLEEERGVQQRDAEWKATVGTSIARALTVGQLDATCVVVVVDAVQLVSALREADNGKGEEG